ncbi:MAG: hypothetical protein ACK5Q5_02725 [Planctomycetaceae bacterium]
MRWENVDLPGGKITVDSPKTEHMEGHEYRVVPIPAELRPYLEQAWDRAPEKAEWVVATWRGRGKNFRTRLLRAIRRAGLKPWPRLFHNLRSSCQTDMEQVFPNYVVCKWLGNTERVAREHYLQVTEEHFQRAGSDALRNALQKVIKTTEESGTNGSDFDGDPQKMPKKRKETETSGNNRSSRYPRQGSNLQPPA